MAASIRARPDRLALPLKAATDIRLTAAKEDAKRIPAISTSIKENPLTGLLD